MLKILELFCQVLVIRLNLGNNGIPGGGEVQKGECGAAFVQVSNELIQALWSLVALVLVCQE